ncbi:hypothetical protein RRG08_036363 [Elysia crispata]|uniref:Uncharacterized protein n=1 Tax=Elysia crispata TaxID=231223 RepID=A0AAE1DHH6_9GAST|nr:hypothetical protein RRG08_036363 [Elysia crispata]
MILCVRVWNGAKISQLTHLWSGLLTVTPLSEQATRRLDALPGPSTPWLALLLVAGGELRRFTHSDSFCFLVELELEGRRGRAVEAFGLEPARKSLLSTVTDVFESKRITEHHTSWLLCLQKQRQVGSDQSVLRPANRFPGGACLTTLTPTQREELAARIRLRIWPLIRRANLSARASGVES